MNARYGQLLVHLDATGALEARLRLARMLAQQCGARVCALYAASPSFVELPSAPMLAPQVGATLAEVDDARRERALRVFTAANDTPGARADWAETSDLPVVGAFVQQALFADLLVLGQRDPQDPLAAALPRDFSQSVVMDSGKPALVVPYAGQFDHVGQTVAIAWKATRESARAVAGAMPLLQRAAQVHVLSWGDDEAVGAGVAGARLDLESYLRLYGVQAIWHAEGPAPDALGETLLSRVCDLQADLLVMGCYGHSRARELVLGGVSRTVWQSMTVPVLMAH